MMRRIYGVIGNSIVIALVTGCAVNSGIVPLGADTYMVSRSTSVAKYPGEGSESYRLAALKEAREYCESRNKVMQVYHMDVSHWPSPPAAEVRFMCLSEAQAEAKRDAEARRPAFKTDDGSVVELNKTIRIEDDSSKYGELRELKRLLDDGVLSQAEYEKEKTRLLNR